MQFFLSQIIDFIIHIDEHLTQLTQTYGTLTYAILFAIIFAETGFVVTPFLPGDSLLFAAGAIAAIGDLNIFMIVGILITAAILGDTVNYWIGHFFGDKIIAKKFSFIKKEHIEKTQKFYKKHGGKTIILARFVPIVRTFAPFVAGIGKMHYGNFITYNVVGGIVWVAIFAFAGYFFGNLPAVKHNFTVVVFGIIGVSVLPMFIEFIKSRKGKTNQESLPEEEE
jgi:membrane-associated protein